jgi:3-deoxy-D-manno-octulosonate 8-phosphate phosphatase (KDO 8-P phosphatase)
MIDIKKLDAVVFDFDGVFTDNRVFISENGIETVCCNRSDGLACDVLRQLNLKLYILSTESNPVVSLRAKKLKIDVYQNERSKVQALKSLAQKDSFCLSRTLYVGNDINDFDAMKACAYSACPSDSHLKIKKIATCKLDAIGGGGVVRELVESVLGIEMIQYIS